MAKHGYEDKSIEDVRQELIELGVEDEEVLRQSKKPLVELLLQKKKEEDIKDIVIDKDSIEQEPEDDADIPATELDRPAFGSHLWSDYVMSRFHDDELENNCPTCDGLRRVVEELLGPIVSSGINHSVAPDSSNRGTATVAVGIVLRVNKDETHPMNEQEDIYAEDIANCGAYNTDHPFSIHQSATAATRAEGRALRKLLRLKKVVAAEELAEETNVDFEEVFNPSRPITDEQINVIDLLCKRLNVDVLRYISAGKFTYDKIENVPYEKAAKVIQHLNAVQRGKKDFPEIFKNYPYDNGWRDRSK